MESKTPINGMPNKSMLKDMLHAAVESGEIDRETLKNMHKRIGGGELDQSLSVFRDIVDKMRSMVKEEDDPVAEFYSLLEYCYVTMREGEPQDTYPESMASATLQMVCSRILRTYLDFRKAQPRFTDELMIDIVLDSTYDSFVEDTQRVANFITESLADVFEEETK